ncbi:unnamed protein product [Bubo scandiacus]
MAGEMRGDTLAPQKLVRHQYGGAGGIRTSCLPWAQAALGVLVPVVGLGGVPWARHFGLLGELRHGVGVRGFQGGGDTGQGSVGCSGGGGIRKPKGFYPHGEKGEKLGRSKDG